MGKSTPSGKYHMNWFQVYSVNLVNFVLTGRGLILWLLLWVAVIVGPPVLFFFATFLCGVPYIYGRAWISATEKVLKAVSDTLPPTVADLTGPVPENNRKTPPGFTSEWK